MPALEVWFPGSKNWSEMKSNPVLVFTRKLGLLAVATAIVATSLAPSVPAARADVGSESEILPANMQESESETSQGSSSEWQKESAQEAPLVTSKSARSKPVVPTRASGDSDQPETLTLKSGINYTVPRGTSMNLKITQVPSNGMKLLQKDLEGNPMPAKINDVIQAMITEDIYVDGDKVIPEGTVFRGRVVHLHGARRVQRPGWVDIAFNELELPNHRIFRFKAQADNLEPSTLKSKLNAVGMISANAFGGAVIGVMVAYAIFGEKGTAQTKGINIGAGAAGGALLAAGHAIMKRGHKAWLEPGDGLNIAIDTDMVMPALSEPTKHVAVKNEAEGLVIDVLKSKVIKDGIGGHFIRLDVNIFNGSDKTLQAIDLYLRDTNGNKCPVAMGPGDDDDSTFLFHLEPGSSLRSKLYFDVQYAKLAHEFVWYDHVSRKVCFRQKLQM